MCSNTLFESKTFIFALMKKHTIKNIAELAGVSKGTVDRVIHKRGKVSQAAHTALLISSWLIWVFVISRSLIHHSLLFGEDYCS